MVVLYQVLQQDLTQMFEPPACEGLEDIIKLVCLELFSLDLQTFLSILALSNL